MRVVHCKSFPHGIYIGRPSFWGNPFSVEEFGRTQAIAKYEEYLLNNLRTGVWTEEMLLELDGKVLRCWCSPKPCHGDILVKYVTRIKFFRKLGISFTKQLQKP